MFKKLISIFMLLSLLALLVVGCAPAANTPDTPDGGTKKLKVAFVLPGSISDGAFGTISYQGVQVVKEADFIEKADFIEGVSASTDAAKAIRDYIADGYDVVWAQSGLHSAAVMETAPQFPDNVFVALATPPSDQTFDNIWFNLTESESAYYIAGALSAFMTTSNTIGYVGARENPLYVACSKAYEEGAKSINPNIKVLSVLRATSTTPLRPRKRLSAKSRVARMSSCTYRTWA